MKKTIHDLTPEELDQYKNFLYMVHFKNFLDLYGLDMVRLLSIEIFHSSCFKVEDEGSQIPDFIKSLYYVARNLKSTLADDQELSDEAIKFIRDNLPDKYREIRMAEFLSNLN